MKKIKKIIVSVLCVVMCFSMCINASAACTLTLSEVAKVTGFQNVTTQGMCIDRTTNYAYSAKIGNGNTSCMIIRTNLSTGKSIIMKNSLGKETVSYLGHANDMTFVNIGSEKYIYVVFGRGIPGVKETAIKYDIVKLKITGSTFEKVSIYQVYYGNASGVYIDQPISGLAFVAPVGNNLVFFAKKGNDIYSLEIPSNQKNGIVYMSKKCTLDTTAYANYGTPQNIAYIGGNILVTYHQEGTKNNVVINYDREQYLSVPEYSFIKPDKSFSFKVNGSSAYSKYEIEAVDIRKNGNPYVIVNAKISKSDADHLLVCEYIAY